MNNRKKATNMKRLFAIFVSAALLLSALTASAFADEQKVLHWYIEGEITTMDSGKTYDTLSGEAVAYFADSLYRLDQNSEPVPNLAAALPEISEDGLTVTVTIRDDAYYANGEKIVAADIEYAVQRVFDPAVGSQNTSIASIKNKDAVRAGELPVSELGVKALSDTVIEFTLEAPDPYIVKKLADTAYAPVNRAFAEEKGDQYGLSAKNLLASGPYSLADWSGTDISWCYIKNPYYWDKDNVYFDVIEIQVVKDTNTAINLYEAGQLDGVKLSSDYIPQFEGQPDLVKIRSLRMTNLELGISSNTALQNLNIRKALTYLFIAHDLSMVKYISDRIAVMYHGHIVEMGDAEEIYSHPLHPYTRSLVSAILLPDPQSERLRRRIPYVPDEERNDCTLREVGPGHFVYAAPDERYE